MRRIGRWMLNALTALSLLLCVGTCGLWVRGYWVADTFGYAAPRWQIYTFSTRGAITFYSIYSVDQRKSWIGHSAAKPWTETSMRFHEDDDTGVTSERSLPGVAWRISKGGTGRGRSVPAPPGMRAQIYFWNYPPRRDFYVRDSAIVSLFAILPSVQATRRIFRRKNKGGCPACSYDLTANVSGVCPECGTKIAEAK